MAGANSLHRNLQQRTHSGGITVVSRPGGHVLTLTEGESLIEYQRGAGGQGSTVASRMREAYSDRASFRSRYGALMQDYVELQAHAKELATQVMTDRSLYRSRFMSKASGITGSRVP